MAQGSTQAVITALVCNLGIAGAKFAGALVTGSSAMLSEAIHSLIDTSNQTLLLYGQSRANRPADARHPFGYARELYFWSFVVAILLFSLGAGVAIYEGVDKILHPHAVTNPEINYAILGVALLLEGISLRSALLAFNESRGSQSILAAMRASKDAALITLLFEDTAALAGIAIALAGVFAADRFGIAWADGAASIAIGLLLATVAAFVAIEVKSLLIGEAAAPQVECGVREIIAADAKAHRLIQKIHDIRTLQLGAHAILVTASLDVDDNARAGDIEAANDRLEAAVRARYPDVQHLYIKVQSPSGAAASALLATDSQRTVPPPSTPAPGAPVASKQSAQSSTKRGKHSKKRR